MAKHIGIISLSGRPIILRRSKSLIWLADEELINLALTFWLLTFSDRQTDRQNIFIAIPPFIASRGTICQFSANKSQNLLGTPVILPISYWVIAKGRR